MFKPRIFSKAMHCGHWFDEEGGDSDVEAGRDP